jgi:hypothetical protein
VEWSKYETSHMTFDPELEGLKNTVVGQAQATLLEVNLVRSFKLTGDEKFQRVKFFTGMYGDAPKGLVHPSLWAEAQRVLGRPLAKATSGAVPVAAS